MPSILQDAQWVGLPPLAPKDGVAFLQWHFLLTMSTMSSVLQTV
jgi:hypothetical protein